ncbi:MAG TPA: LysR family transcriptional regulator [Herbaspirillum sp.]|nr:LysR family transcriptional regulator [Herbaspirillum sp.]
MSFLTLDLNLLRVFDAVMTEQNLTRAANLLAMTQPAVSNALRRLRETLNDKLLIRTAHGVKPTPRAEELWPTVRRALSDLEAVITPETFDIAHAQNTFRMAMVDTTAVLWLPALVRTIMCDAPHIKIRMMPLTTRDPRAMLLRGDVDLAVGFFPGVTVQLGDRPKTQINHTRLYTGRYVCVMHKHHPLADKELDIDNYCSANHLLVSLSGKPYTVIDNVLADMGRERKVLLTVNQFFTAGRIVASSDLITVLPHHLIAATGMQEVLVVKELPFETPDEHVDMLWHERDARNPAHKWLRAHLSATTSDEFGRITNSNDMSHVKRNKET